METVFFRHVAVQCCVILGLALSGCGGSSHHTPAPPLPPSSVLIAPTSLVVNGDAAVSSTPTASIAIGISNPPAGGLYVGYHYTVSGIDVVSLQVTSSTVGEIRLSFKNPATIGPGVYTDSVTVQICTDDQCVNQVSGSPRTINVEYTVTGTQAPQPTLVLSSTNVTAGTYWFAGAPPSEAQVAYSIDNNNQYIGVSASYTNNGIQGAYSSSFSGSSNGGAIVITFKSPSELTPGVYNDVITVTAYCNSICPRGVGNGVQQIAVQYEIGDTTTGPNNITARAVPFIANDLVWNSAQEKIYLAAPSSAGEHANSIAVLNPSSGVIESSSFVGSEPSVLALSDDNQYLYVALNGANSVRRKLLPSLAQDILIPMGSASNGVTLVAADIQVAPAQPQTVAIVQMRSDQSSYPINVSIYDGGTLRPNVSTTSYARWLQWGGSATRLYGSSLSGYGYLLSFDVDVNGVALLSSQIAGNSNTGRIQFANGVLYTSSGEAFDPVTQAKLGVFVPSQYASPRAVFADVPLNKLFMIADNGSVTLLQSFNLTTFAPIASIAMSRFGIISSTSRIIRWGADGLAFADIDGYPYNASPQGRVMLITGPFVTNPTN